MNARKKTGPRPLPLRDLSDKRALLPIVSATTLSRSAALVLAASTLLACGGATTTTGAEAYPTSCPRMAGAPMQVEIPAGSATTAPTVAPSIEPAPFTPPLAGGIAPARD